MSHAGLEPRLGQKAGHRHVDRTGTPNQPKRRQKTVQTPSIVSCCWPMSSYKASGSSSIPQFMRIPALPQPQDLLEVPFKYTLARYSLDGRSMVSSCISLIECRICSRQKLAWRAHDIAPSCK